MRLSAVILAALVSAGSGSAMAQPRWADDYPAYGGPRGYYDGDREYYRERGPSDYDGLSAREIHGTLRSRGLRALSQPMRRGDRYVVMARDPYGRTQRVVIDAGSGDIIRVVAARPHVDDPAFHQRPDEDGPRPLPPLNRPRASAPERSPETARPPAAKPPVAAKPAPQQTAKTSPDGPPMPRARPGDAPPNAGKPDNKPSRVILPGGPVPKQDRSAGRSYVPAPAPAVAPVETPPAAAPPPAPEAAPPAPTEAAPATPETPAAGKPDPSIPPAQAF